MDVASRLLSVSCVHVCGKLEYCDTNKNKMNQNFPTEYELSSK